MIRVTRFMQSLLSKVNTFKIANQTPAITSILKNVKSTQYNNFIKLITFVGQNEFRYNAFRYKVVLALNILTWLGFADEDEDKESELIMTLKRAVLCTQREQFEKAEQMLHLALRLAQQQHNEQGVLYCYDLMANLAMDTLQLDKAEKLFVSVLQLLLSKGMEHDNLKVIHISLKLARINQLKADLEKAKLGYEWCLDNINKHQNQNKDSTEGKMLYGIIQDWYAQYLLDIGDISKSLVHLKEAYKICKETRGEYCEQSMLLLNDLGTTNFRAGDLDAAINCLRDAIEIGNSIEEKTHLGVVHANLGLILLEQGLMKEAEKNCKIAWHLGKQHENEETVQHASYCFDQIKLNLNPPKVTT